MEARLEVQVTNLSKKFLVEGSINFRNQYSRIYTQRLEGMQKLLLSRIKSRWGEKYPIKKLCDLHEDESEKCIIIGTIYKHQVHKPSILREISEENQLAPQPPRLHYSDPNDKLILEDELQRVRLCGNVNIKHLVTGICCAVRGKIEENKYFVVKEILFYESGPQRPLKQSGTNKLLMLMSGLDCYNYHNYINSLNLFQYYLNGNINSHYKNNVHLIIAGNTFPKLNIDLSESTETFKRVDKWLSQWSKSIPIDLMPGELDPSNVLLPQQPFNQCMFPEASSNSSFKCATNPYQLELNNTLILGNSGNPIKSIKCVSNLENELDILRSTLIWSHLTPTSPDTLPCYPFDASDPFIISECPHIFFAGNCEKFATEIHTGSDGQRTRLICVPTFSLTKSIAVVDIETLDCHQISFREDE